MASTYKQLGPNDINMVEDFLHEAVPITGTIASGTYSEASVSTTNIKDYVPGKEMLQSVYDYPYLSSSANHIFDLTAGFSSKSTLSGSIGKNMEEYKINIYNQMALTHLYPDISGNIQQFDNRGDSTGTKMKEVFFVSFARLLTKDEIQKQTFTIQVLTGNTVAAPTNVQTISDYKALSQYRDNSPVGEFGILYSGSQAVSGSGVGLIYYQTGLCVLTASIFGPVPPGGPISNYIGNNGAGGVTTNYKTVGKLLVSSSISGCCSAFRNRLYNISFNNTTQINSTIYYCRAHFNEFNYSSNPTYLSASQIRVKTSPNDMARAFITGGGLYNANKECMATFATSTPVEKNKSDEVVIRVRLDY
jgi:hypothetical protein